jgi:asparagine synthetase B (glutamine-hydrolysing)
MIRNHERLNKRFAKAAEVDSAAIMSLLRVKSKSKPMTVDTLANNLHELEGPFAIAVADTRKPNGIFMARNNNPVNFYRERNEGKLWFASTPAILADGLDIEEDRTFEMPANKCCRIDSKAVAGKLKYHSIKRGPTSAIEYDLRRTSATQTTPRVPRIRSYEETIGQDEEREYATSIEALTNAWSKPVKKKKSKKIKQAKVCSKCNEIITTVYMGGIEQDCCACVTISDMMAG